MKAENQILSFNEGCIQFIPREERGIVLRFSVSPLNPQKGLQIESNGHHDPEDFISKVRDELNKKGYESASHALSPQNVIHTSRTCKNALDFAEVIDIKGAPSSFMPTTKLVGVHIPLFGVFLECSLIG